jgi:SOS-response transcriptional repressor LexA
MKDKTRRKLKLTDKQQEARDMVDRLTKKNGFPPTYREVATQLNLSSSNTAYVRLRGYRNKMIKK